VNRKFIVSLSVIFLLVLLTFFLAAYPILLSILILLVGFVKHKIYPIKKEGLMFFLVAVGGGIVEIILVNSGSVWTYSISQFYGIPIWIPFFWGIIATTIVTMYQGLNKK
jgi:hypothetical protein